MQSDDDALKRLYGEPVFEVPAGFLRGAEEIALERCPYCGARVETPCDQPPTDTCDRALRASQGRG